MNTQTTTSEYMLLFRGGQWDKGLAPEQAQKVMNQFIGWFEKLKQEGVLKGGQPLGGEGRTVSGKGGRTVADGPFAESKEAVGGYFMLNVNSLDEAVAIAKQCPVLEYGLALEVRPVLEECPTFKRIREQMALAAA